MTLQHPTDTLDIQALFPDGTQLIGGEWVPARNGDTIPVINPATGETLANVPRGGPDDVADAVAAAEDAFPAWRDTSPSRRGQLLLDWAALCREHAAELDLLERLEVGRPKWGPAGPMAGILTFTAGLADKATGQTLPSMFPDVIGMTLREPYGVCGSIIPWNAPGPNTVNDAGPAIAMGNTIVIKPAEDAPLTCLLLVKLALEAGIPPGVINVVTGYGPEAGEPLAGHPGVRRMSFTGSPETGRRVMEACARHLIPLHLELGGKSPQVVLRDAPLDRAIPTIARSITLNTGQICAAGSRVVVDASIRDEVVSGLADAFKRVRVGPWYEDVDMGPLISAKQEKRVLRISEERSLGGCPRRDRGWQARGRCLRPRVLRRADDLRRGAARDADRPGGDLRAGAVGPQLRRRGGGAADRQRHALRARRVGVDARRREGSAARAADRGRAGVDQHAVVGRRNWTPAHPPFGGYKSSGFGRTVSAESILDYTQVKSVIIDGRA